MRQPTPQEWAYLIVDLLATCYLVWLQQQQDEDALQINALWTWSKCCRWIATHARSMGAAADRRIDELLDRRRTV